MDDFDGLNIVVTGAGTGLGAATAVGAAKRGASGVVINYASSRDAAEAVADLCRDAGAKVALVQGDVASVADCRRMAEVAAPWGSLHALVNNAGTTKFARDHSDLDALSAEDFQRIYGVNTVGPYQMIRACRPLLEAGARSAGRASSVVNVSSVAALNATGSSVAYIASKGALNIMSVALARALAPLIRVNAICPGYIESPWTEKVEGKAVADRFREQVKAIVPLRFAAAAEDVAETVLFLAGPGGRNMTGELVGSDTGYRMLGPQPVRDA